jgi:hypothetical protein
MPDTLQSVVIGAASGVVSSVITYYATRARSRLDLSVARETELHNARLTQYKKLWPMFEDLSRYGRAKPVTHAILKSVSDSTRAWYYAEGGLYLTPASRDPYFRWKRALQALLDNPVFRSDPNQEIPAAAVDAMTAILTELHARLSEDLDTRRTRLF